MIINYSTYQLPSQLPIFWWFFLGASNNGVFWPKNYPSSLVPLRRQAAFGLPHRRFIGRFNRQGSPTAITHERKMMLNQSWMGDGCRWWVNLHESPWIMYFYVEFFEGCIRKRALFFFKAGCGAAFLLANSVQDLLLRFWLPEVLGHSTFLSNEHIKHCLGFSHS